MIHHHRLPSDMPISRTQRSSLPPVLDWTEDAACLGQPDEDFFPEGGRSGTRALKFCAVCPVRKPCLDLALRAEGDLARNARFGIFGGLGPSKRARLAAALRKDRAA